MKGQGRLRSIARVSMALVLAVSLGLIMALPAAGVHTPPGTIYVDEAAAGGGDGSVATPFDTIGEAITHATAGDTITVAAGTYDAASGETFPINLNVADLTIKSADGAATTNISPDPGDESGFNVTAAGVTIGGSGAGFTILPGGRGGIYADETGGDGITVQRNTSKSDADGERRGMWFEKLWGDALITGNSWATPRLGTGMQVVNADGATISNKTVAAGTVKYSWLTFKAEAFYAGPPENRDPVGNLFAEYVALTASTIDDLLVTGNSVVGMDAGREAIKFATSTKPADHGEPQAQDLAVGAAGVTISGNTFTSNGIGVAIDEDEVSDDPGQTAQITGIDNIVITQNNFVGNTLAVENGTTTTVDAEDNYWGVTFTGPIALLTVGPVDHTPWLSAPIAEAASESISANPLLDAAFYSVPGTVAVTVTH